jgi:hypothetical protein
MNKGFHCIIHLAHVLEYVVHMLEVHTFSILSKGSCIHHDKIGTRTFEEIIDGYEVSMICAIDQSNNATLARAWDHHHTRFITVVSFYIASKKCCKFSHKYISSCLKAV